MGAVFSPKGSLLYSQCPCLVLKAFWAFPFLRLYLMVSCHHIQTRKIFGLQELITYFHNVRQKMGVPYCFLVQASEVYYQTPILYSFRANTLEHHQYRTVPRGITFNYNPVFQYVCSLPISFFPLTLWLSLWTCIYRDGPWFEVNGMFHDTSTTQMVPRKKKHILVIETYLSKACLFLRVKVVPS